MSLGLIAGSVSVYSPVGLISGSVCLFRCSSDEWRCPGLSDRCVPQKSVCDGKPDCPNGADEGTGCDLADCKARPDCYQGCMETPLGAQCLCPAGERLNGTKECIDIDECLVPGKCSQMCHNVKGSYYCTCASGYNQTLDKHGCKPSGELVGLLLGGGSVGNVLLLPDLCTIAQLIPFHVLCVTSRPWQDASSVPSAGVWRC